MELTFPAPPDPNQKVEEVKKGITFLLSKDDRIFYYEGQFRAVDDEKGAKTTLSELSFSQDKNGLHKFLLEKNKEMQDQIQALDVKHKNKQ